MCWLSVALVEVEWVAVEVSEHVILKYLLVAVQRELLAAHGADFPVALHVLLELALVVVGREDDLAQRTPLHVHAAYTGKERGGRGGGGEAPAVRSEMITWPSDGRRLNKEHLSDAWWVACALTNAKRRELPGRTSPSHVLQCAGGGKKNKKRRAPLTRKAFMRVGACGLRFTWDQSRRQSVHH